MLNKLCLKFVSFGFDTELERDADEEQIKLAYRRLAKFYHPDGLSFTMTFTFWVKFSYGLFL